MGEDIEKTFYKRVFFLCMELIKGSSLKRIMFPQKYSCF